MSLSRIAAALLPPMGRATEAVLFHGVPGAPSPPTDPDAWRLDAQEISEHRLAPLAIACTSNARIALPPEVNDTLRGAHRALMVQSLALEAWAPTAYAALRDRGIPSVITKGPGFARAYPLVAERPFRDLDVFVAPGDFERATAVFTDDGFTEPEFFFGARSYFNRRCREAITLTRAGGLAVDLHHHVPPWIWGARLPFAAVSAAAEDLALDRGTIRIPGPSHAHLIAALHILSDRGRRGHDLLMWRDLVATAARVDPVPFAAEMRARDLAWCVALVLRALPAYARPRALIDALGDVRPRGTDRMRLERLIPPARFSEHMIARAFRLPVPNAIAYLAGYAFPSRAFLRTRYGSPRAYGRWWRDAGSGLRAD